MNINHHANIAPTSKPKLAPKWHKNSRVAPLAKRIKPNSTPCAQGPAPKSQPNSQPGLQPDSQPEPQKIQLARLSAQKKLKKIFMAALLSAVIHSGLFLGVYWLTTAVLNSELPSQPGQPGPAGMEIDLRSLYVSAEANPFRENENLEAQAKNSAPTRERQANNDDTHPRASGEKKRNTEQETQIELPKPKKKVKPLTSVTQAKQADQNNNLNKPEQLKSHPPAVVDFATPAQSPQSSSLFADPTRLGQGQNSATGTSANNAPDNGPYNGPDNGRAMGRGPDNGKSTGNNAPRLMANPKPNYPPLARQRGQEGLVLLVVQVDKHGKPDAIEIQTSSGYPLLDQAALQGLEKWKFKPAQVAGVAVAASVQVPVEFKLND